MKVYFDIISTCDICFETHIPRRQLESYKVIKDRVPLEERVPGELSRYLHFDEYVKDEAGDVVGVKFTCNCGDSDGNPVRYKEVLAYPGDEVKFTHDFMSIDDDGYPEENCTFVSFKLEWHEE